MRIVSFASMVSIMFMAWLLMSLSGCHKTTSVEPPAPKGADFKAGQCIMHTTDDTKEKWEKNDVTIYKILELGKHKYHTVTWHLVVDRNVGTGSWMDWGLMFDDYDFCSKKYFKVVNCPDGSGEQKPVKENP